MTTTKLRIPPPRHLQLAYRYTCGSCKQSPVYSFRLKPHLLRGHLRNLLPCTGLLTFARHEWLHNDEPAQRAREEVRASDLADALEGVDE